MSNLMSKQGSFWMILSSAVATRPEVILKAAHFHSFLESDRLVSLPQLAHLYNGVMAPYSCQGTEVLCNPHDSVSWNIIL